MSTAWAVALAVAFLACVYGRYVRNIYRAWMRSVRAWALDALSSGTKEKDE